jgi:hypothetical protein
MLIFTDGTNVLALNFLRRPSAIVLLFYICQECGSKTLNTYTNAYNYLYVREILLS